MTGTRDDGAESKGAIIVTVIGEDKPDRFTSTVTDLRVPLVGLPVEIRRAAAAR